ncbi:MAG UNVERIFIED_CONTAM: hypothetical protein LVR29_12770 [Microcystis novacekii LVE1205-3]
MGGDLRKSNVGFRHLNPTYQNQCDRTFKSRPAIHDRQPSSKSDRHSPKIALYSA